MVWNKHKVRPRKDLTKEQVLLAMRHTKSNRSAARYCNVSYQHYRAWAKQYNEFEGGRTLFDIHLNQSGRGIPKFLAANSKKSKFNVLDIIEGRVASSHFKPEWIKKKMIEEGYLKEECEVCGFSERRVSDYKIPLILNFKDNDPTHFGLNNCRFLCYNHYFIYIDNIFNNKDTTKLETHQDVNGTSPAVDFQLDEYQKKQLAKLGLYEPPKADNDGTEFVSRI